MTTTPTAPAEPEFVDALTEHASRNEVIQSQIVDPIEATGEVADAEAEYEIDLIADEVLGSFRNGGYAMTAGREEFWDSVARHAKADHSTKLRHFTDYFRPVDEPDNDELTVLGVVADLLTYDQITTLGDLIERVRRDSGDRGVRDGFRWAIDAIRNDAKKLFDE